MVGWYLLNRLAQCRRNFFNCLSSLRVKVAESSDFTNPDYFQLVALVQCHPVQTRHVIRLDLNGTVSNSSDPLDSVFIEQEIAFSLCRNNPPRERVLKRRGTQNKERHKKKAVATFLLVSMSAMLGRFTAIASDCGAKKKQEKIKDEKMSEHTDGLRRIAAGAEGEKVHSYKSSRIVRTIVCARISLSGDCRD